MNPDKSNKCKAKLSTCFQWVIIVLQKVNEVKEKWDTNMLRNVTMGKCFRGQNYQSNSGNSWKIPANRAWFLLISSNTANQHLNAHPVSQEQNFRGILGCSSRIQSAFGAGSWGTISTAWLNYRCSVKNWKAGSGN